MESASPPASSLPVPGVKQWIHVCERCGARMVEEHCKILCKTCGFIRDCSDP